MTRWIIASNRLPFSYNATSNQIKPSSGGLVTAIRGIRASTPIVWVGSVAEHVPESAIQSYRDKANVQFSCITLSSQLYDNYYNRFCNDVLWPILHYEADLVKFDESRWRDYVKVNEIFAERIVETARKDDLIWLHDFHLFLCAKFIKKQRPELRVGFFLHVPFPSSEVYRQLPCREEILDSLLYCDLVGFHDFSYLRHFASSVYTLMGYQSSLLAIRSRHGQTKLGVFPVSIDTQSFYRKAKSKKTQCEIEKYHLVDGKQKYILGVDRLDYTKGIIHKLKAFQIFLRKYPSQVGKVQLVQIAVPSRTEVEEYIQLRHDVERLVSEINGEFSRLDYIPVRYIFNSVSTPQLMALYRSSSVLFVTSKRDGMNLVCLEYIAAQDTARPGVVLLSEYTGAASTLSHATVINPMDFTDTAEKLKQALSQPLAERRRNHSIMLKYLLNYTGTEWAQSFIGALRQSRILSKPKIKDLDSPEELNTFLKLIKSRKKSILIDYDGTLTPIVNNPADAIIPTSTKNLIRSLQKRKDYDVTVVSGRTADFLEGVFKGVNLSLACEHGGRFYDQKNCRWRSLVASKKSDWFKYATQIIRDYTRRTPNSFFEQKKYAIAWHYRNSPADFSEFQARRLVEDLESSLVHAPVSIILGKKVVEVKALEANKGYFSRWYVDRYTDPEDAIIAIGDDRTDEDMFTALKGRAYTIKVGEPEATSASYYVRDQKHVENLLKSLLHL